MGFREFITNRWYRKHLGESLERYQSIQPPPNPSRRYVDKLVKRLLDERTAWDARKELTMIGAAAVPSLAAALAGDKRFLSTERVRPTVSAPFQMMLELLVPHGPQHVLAAAMPLMRHKSRDVRKTVAMNLASLGRAETLPVLAELLRDEDGYVRSYATIGVSRAVSACRADDAFRRGAYDLLLAQCDQKWAGTGNECAGVLIALDPARAAVDLATPRLLSPHNPVVYELINACNQAGVLLPEPLLRAALDHSMALAVGERCYPHQYVSGAALEALALRVGDNVRPVLEAALRHEQRQIRESAARGIVTLAGLSNPTAFVWERMQAVGFDGLTPPQRVVYLGNTFDGEVCNGGITQFFGNSSGDHAAETLDALRQLGVPEAERLLTEAMRMIGPLAREGDRESRLLAFEGRFEQLMEAFRPLESAYYKADSRLRQAVLLYAARHAEHFRHA